jgi:hypothetical protein
MITKKLTHWYDSDATYHEVEKHWTTVFPEVLDRVFVAVKTYDDPEDPHAIPNFKDVLIEPEAITLILSIMDDFGIQGVLSSKKQLVTVGDVGSIITKISKFVD